MYSSKPDEGIADNLVCRNKRAVRSHGVLGTAEFERCGRHLGYSALPLVETGRILDAGAPPARGCIAAFCRDCKLSTEYRVLTQLEAA